MTKFFIFSLEDYDDRKIHVQAYSLAMNDKIQFVIKEGPIKILKANTTAGGDPKTPYMIEKPRAEWVYEDRKRANLDNVARDIMYKTILDKVMFNKIKSCKITKEIWEKITIICERTDQIKENKLTIATQNFENYKMKFGENWVNLMQGSLI